MRTLIGKATAFSAVAAAVLVCVPGTRADISPQPTLTVPAGFVATPLASTPDALSSLGFDLDGALLAGKQNTDGGCGGVGTTANAGLYRFNADGTVTQIGFDHQLSDPGDILVGSPGTPTPDGNGGTADWQSTLYVVDAQAGEYCTGGVFRLDPSLAPNSWRNVGFGGSLGDQLTGGAFGPDGYLYAVDSYPLNTVGGQGGLIERYAPCCNYPSLVYEGQQGAPFENPISAEFGSGAYGGDPGGDLWISDNGREGPTGTDDGFIVKFDVGAGSYTLFPGRPGDHFWRETFAPPGAFGENLYVIDNPKHELDTVSPTGQIAAFATWTGAANSLNDVAASADGRHLYVLMDDTNNASTIFDVTRTVTPTTTSLSSSSNPVNLGRQVTYTASVTPAPDGGTVAFSDAGTPIAGCDSAPVDTSTGRAACSVAYDAGGTHEITATYSGDAAFAGSPSSALEQTVVGPPSAQIGSPAAGATFNLNQSVTTSFSCSDAPGGPGVSSCTDGTGSTSPGVLDTSTPGAHTYTVTATSLDGQTGTAHVGYTVVGPPSAQITAPVDGRSFALGQSVSTTFGCSEASGGPGIKSCTDGSGSTSPGSLDTSTPGTHTYTVTATSLDGQTASAHIGYTVVGPPSAQITSPADNQTFVIGQSVLTTFGCLEGLGGPGIAACVDGSGAGSPGVLDTSVPGTHAYTVTSTSLDGLRGTATIHYTVVYSTAGFTSPVANAPTVNLGKGGRSYPLKWQLKDANGNFISSLSAVNTITVQATSCTSFTSDPAAAVATTSTGSTSLRYDSTANQYVYNWATPGPGCFSLFVTLAGGQRLTAFFELT